MTGGRQFEALDSSGAAGTLGAPYAPNASWAERRKTLNDQRQRSAQNKNKTYSQSRFFLLKQA
jgi:hypothetical protein